MCAIKLDCRDTLPAPPFLNAVNITGILDFRISDVIHADITCSMPTKRLQLDASLENSRVTRCRYFIELQM